MLWQTFNASASTVGSTLGIKGIQYKHYAATKLGFGTPISHYDVKVWTIRKDLRREEPFSEYWCLDWVQVNPTLKVLPSYENHYNVYRLPHGLFREMKNSNLLKILQFEFTAPGQWIENISSIPVLLLISTSSNSYGFLNNTPCILLHFLLCYCVLLILKKYLPILFLVVFEILIHSFSFSKVWRFGFE